MESGHASVKKTVQARTVGITDLEADGVVADKAQIYWPRLERLAPWFLRNANCQDTLIKFNSAGPTRGGERRRW
jgi:hypothetical protein